MKGNCGTFLEQRGTPAGPSDPRRVSWGTPTTNQSRCFPNPRACFGLEMRFNMELGLSLVVT